MLSKKGDEDEVELGLNIANRLAFLLYWFFDNLNILASIKFIKRDPKQFAKLGATFWFIALIAGLISYVRQLLTLLSDEARTLKAKPENEADKAPRAEKLSKINRLKSEVILNIVKSLGDLIPAMSGAEIPQKLFKRTFNDGWIGIGGLISAVITSYQLY